MTRLRIRGFPADERGAAAAEFALILPVIAGFVFGFMHLCLLTYSAGQLHWAAEAAARCASVETACRSGAPAATDWTLVQTRITGLYKGLTAAPTLTHPTSSCGNTVTLNASYVLNAVIFKRTFALSASSCYPV